MLVAGPRNQQKTPAKPGFFVGYEVREFEPTNKLGQPQAQSCISMASRRQGQGALGKAQADLNPTPATE